MIGIIDYRMGNLRSVQKAFEHVGAAARILTRPLEVQDVGKLVLPGVGAYADGMNHLGEMGWIPAIRHFLASGQPFLGVCLGMQLLFAGSEEDAPAVGELVPGLDVLPGQVVRFRQATPPQPRIKIPHMGWNTLRFDPANPLFADLPQEVAVYFVHSYYVQPDQTAPAELASATTPYGGTEFCSAIWRDNIWATQFHPEKSQRAGLKMLANFARL